jgi:hypothetical protein
MEKIMEVIIHLPIILHLLHLLLLHLLLQVAVVKH